MSSGIVESVHTSYDLALVIARNIRYFMERPGSLYKTANAISVKAKIAANTVRNYLDPQKRTTTAEKPDGFPTLDKLDRIAQVFGVPVWQLLHPDLERAMREAEMYKKIEADFKHLLPPRDGIKAREKTY